MTGPRSAIVLPARYHSTRFPGKPLAVIAGKPLIQWVYERARGVRDVARVVVATDHADIASAATGFGAEVVMTSPDLATGTDRVAAVAAGLDEEIVVNLQGDEPMFPRGLVEELIAVCAKNENTDIVTACHRIEDGNERDNRHVVKVVADREGRAMYFSRSPIPFDAQGDAICYRHVGIYVFRRESLVRFATLDRTPLEVAEQLEQLRALENGMTIRLVETRQTTIGVDTPDDIKSVEKALASTYSS